MRPAFASPWTRGRSSRTEEVGASILNGEPTVGVFGFGLCACGARLPRLPCSSLKSGGAGGGWGGKKDKGYIHNLDFFFKSEEKLHLGSKRLFKINFYPLKKVIILQPRWGPIFVAALSLPSGSPVRQGPL